MVKYNSLKELKVEYMDIPNVANEKFSTKSIVGLMVLAYLFSFMIRLIWIYQFQDNPGFYWNGQLMINTNDGYFFASGAQQALWDMHQSNPRIPGIASYGLVFFTTLFTKITPFSFETIILYMPAVISSLVVIPIILIAKLYNQALWGFFAALLGSIAWSYYNRTMVGYFDTDMFSAMAPMFILYFLMKSTIDFDLKSALYAGIAIAIYPFLYDQGRAIIYAIGVLYAVYMIFYHRKESTTYLSLILVFIALIPLPLSAPWGYLLKIAILFGLYIIFQKKSIDKKMLMITSGILFLLFLYFGNVFALILGKVMGYLTTGTKTEGLHYYSVMQTVREAGKIPFETFANRISGSQWGLFVAAIGYIVLIIRHRAFILALPLVGIGLFALWGGLRFTVYAVPIAAMSATYLFYIVGMQFNKKVQYALLTLGTVALIYPNIQHIISYKVPTVMSNAEVKDLTKLNKIASDKDYTLAWWDYGYPVWFYSDTNTLIDGGKHNNDNFIVSTVLQTSSPQLAANLSRIAVEDYAENKGVVTDSLFAEKDPNSFLSSLRDPHYKLPKKTRDIYLYLPYKMMNIFPTVALFGNLDLTTGKPKRKIMFYPTRAIKNDKGFLYFSNGIVFDSRNGKLFFGKQRLPIKYFIATQIKKDGKLQIQTQPYYADGEIVIVFMKSYGQFIIMDDETFNSMYVQMFILGKYDKDLFELVVSSPYSKIYKLKK